MGACVASVAAEPQFLAYSGVAHPRVYAPRVVSGAYPASYVPRVPLRLVSGAIRAPYTTRVVAAPYAATKPVVAAPAASVATPIVSAAPAPYVASPKAIDATAPVVAAIPEGPAVYTQFHAQDEFGNYQYGYSNINSQKHEIGNAIQGTVEGTYSYVDGHGDVQTRNYVSDALGFRVKATDLPVAPAAAPVAPIRQKRAIFATDNLFAPIAPIAPVAGIPTAFPYASFPAPYAGFTTPYAGVPVPYAGLPAVAPTAVVPSAPATAEATMMTIQNNPGHAISYRVY